jgi:hypothetical protein
MCHKGVIYEIPYSSVRRFRTQHPSSTFVNRLPGDHRPVAQSLIPPYACRSTDDAESVSNPNMKGEIQTVESETIDASQGVRSGTVQDYVSSNTGPAGERCDEEDEVRRFKMLMERPPSRKKETRIGSITAVHRVIPNRNQTMKKKRRLKMNNWNRS